MLFTQRFSAILTLIHLMIMHWLIWHWWLCIIIWTWKNIRKCFLQFFKCVGIPTHPVPTADQGLFCVGFHTRSALILEQLRRKIHGSTILSIQIQDIIVNKKLRQNYYNVKIMVCRISLPSRSLWQDRFPNSQNWIEPIFFNWLKNSKKCQSPFNYLFQYQEKCMNFQTWLTNPWLLEFKFVKNLCMFSYAPGPYDVQNTRFE